MTRKGDPLLATLKKECDVIRGSSPSWPCWKWCSVWQEGFYPLWPCRYRCLAWWGGLYPSGHIDMHSSWPASEKHVFSTLTEAATPATCTRTQLCYQLQYNQNRCDMLRTAVSRRFLMLKTRKHDDSQHVTPPLLPQNGCKCLTAFQSTTVMRAASSRPIVTSYKP